MKRRLFWAVAYAAVALLWGCGPEEKHRSAGQGALTLYCGAGIRSAAEALIAEWERGGGPKVVVTYGGGGRLLGQILTFPQGDLFMPGDEGFVNSAIEKGVADSSTMRTVAWFTPVILVAKGNPLNIHDLRDLLRPAIRMGIGDERACPVGKTAILLATANGLSLEAFSSNVVYRSATVEELPLAIRCGTIDAAIVWDTTGRNLAEQGHGEVIAIPEERNIPSPVTIIILRSSANLEHARKFVDFVTSETGKAILATQKYAIRKPGTAQNQGE